MPKPSYYKYTLEHPLINEASVVLGGNPCTDEGDLEFVSFDSLNYTKYAFRTPELKTLECDILNPDLLINLEIKKKSGSSINPDIHHSKVPSSELGIFE